MMEEKLKEAIGIPNDVVVNKELGLIIGEQRKKKKADKHEPLKMKPLVSASGSWWMQRWPSLKPFVNGGAVGFLAGSWACLYYSKTGLFAYCRTNPKFHCLTKVFPGVVYIHVLTMSQQLGLYEILRKKAISTNQGMPPTLYQEAACGLAVGAAGACISFPLCLGYYVKQLQSSRPPWSYKGVVLSVYYIVIPTDKRFPDIRRFISPFFKRKMWLDMGMLASYNPSLRYLRESCGFSETRAQLGASAISAFFAAACSLPVKHISLAQEKSGHASTLDCAFKILKSRGPLGFFTGSSACFVRVAPPIMTTWFVLERIRKLELSIGL